MVLKIQDYKYSYRCYTFYGSYEGNELVGLSIFTVPFFLFLTPAGGSNPAGHSLTLTKPNLN